MTESNAERLERIKRENNLIYDADMVWLIEQAGKVPKLKEQNHQYRMKYENTGAVMGRAEVMALREENKRLKQALEGMRLAVESYSGMPMEEALKYVIGLVEGEPK